MGPYLDIYGLTKHRQLDTIERFLAMYIDRAANEDRGDEELLIDAPETPLSALDVTQYVSEPAHTLTHSMLRGLEQPSSCFTLYLTARDPTIGKVMIGFTADRQLSLGLSILDAGALPENLAWAKALLQQMVTTYDCYMGLIMVEEPPPRNEAAYRHMADAPLSLYFEERK